MNQNKHSYQAYLFDMDGSLVDSEPLKGKALSYACAHYGAQADYHIYQEVMGSDWPTVTQHFFKSTKIEPDINEFNQIFKQQYQALLQSELKLTKNVHSYLLHLKQEGLKIGVVSSAAGWMLNQILCQLELDDFFDIVISQEDVSQHKPHPEAYLLALEKLGIAPNKVLVFEDSYAGISAATKAGCDVIAIKHEFNRHNDLHGAKASLSDFSELLGDVNN